MTALRVGVQLQPQGTSVAALRDAWCRYEELGVDSIWLWDHLRPFVGDPSARALDAVTLLGLLAADTSRATIGVLVSPLTFRHPALLARSTAVAHEASGGRVVLGVGAGGFAPDDVLVNELTATGETGGQRFERRLDQLLGHLAEVLPAELAAPRLLIAGSGRRTMLPLTARHADAWNAFGPPAAYAEANDRLTRLCRREGRDADDVERTVLLRRPDDPVDPAAFVAAGATHLIRSVRAPFDDAVDRDLVRTLLDLQR